MAEAGSTRPQPTPLSEPLPPGMVESGSPSHQHGAPPGLSPSAAAAAPARQVSPAPGLAVGSLSPVHQQHLDIRTPTESPSRAGSKPATSRSSPSRQPSKERRPSKLTPSQASRRPSFRNSKSELLETMSPGTAGVRIDKISFPEAGDGAGTSYSDVHPFAAEAGPAGFAGGWRPSRAGQDHTQVPSRAGSHAHSSAAASGDHGDPTGSRSHSHGPSAGMTRQHSPPAPTAEDIYAELRGEVDANVELHAEERDYNGGLELAALARLRVWERGDKLYSVRELMDLVRWMEARTEPAPARSTILWRGFRTTKAHRRICPVVLAFLLLGAVLVAIAATTALALIITTPAPVATTGLLEGSEEQPAGLAAAMHPHSLLDYERLSAGQLRHAEDVVLQQRGDFHFYRLAGATQLMSGGIRLASQDGSVIRVEDNFVSLKPAWSLEEAVDADGMAKLESARGSSSLSFTGAFRALSPH
mmetsp:Transcript_133655/g.250027  ORF Transcript_133655/g.250027 Transcript_133655/m.250027 type:complete len:473 (+) Transcript_133655:91-1509(+)